MVPVVALSRDDIAKYRPRTIGYPEPLGKDAFEFAIYGNDAPSSIVRLTDQFLEHGACLLNHRLDWNDLEQKFAAFYMVDMSRADRSSSELAEILRSRSGVEEVRVISRAGAIFGYSSFPIILNGVNRGVILRVEDWSQVEEDLVGWMGTAGETIMFREGESYGASIGRRYVRLIGTDDQLLIQNVRDGMKATGWGIMDHRISDDRNTFFLEVKYPITNSKGEVVSKFFQGLTCGLIEVILDAKLTMQEANHDQKTGILRIRYKIDWQKTPPRSEHMTV